MRLKGFLILMVIYCQMMFGQQALPKITFSNSLVSSIQMTGSVTWVYGSDQQTGTVVLQAYANGQSRMELHLTNGIWIEMQDPFSTADRQCSWTGFDGVNHTTASHNCFLSAIWFLPQITMQAGAGVSDSVTSVTANGTSAQVHIERHPSQVRNSGTAQLLAQVSALDITVDTSTGFVSSLMFNAHPEDNTNINIANEILFSEYRTVNAVTIPFHIQKFLNHALALDMQISSFQIQTAASTPTLSTSLQR